VDGRSDVFSAGVVLYQLLTGARPFVGSTSVVMQQILNITPAPPSRVVPTLGSALDYVLERALAKVPAERFESAQDFLNALLAAQHGGMVGSNATTALEDEDRTLLAGEVHASMVKRSSAERGTERTTSSGSENPGTEAAAFSTWKLEAMPVLDVLLTHQIGPMAKFLLKKVAAKSDNIDALSDSLLPHIPSELGRVQFLKAVDELKKKLMVSGTVTGSGARTLTGLSVGPLATTLPGTMQGIALHTFDTTFADAVTRQLTVFIGPIARVVAKRAMNQTQNKSEFLRLMAQQIATLPERNRFLAEAGHL